MLLVAFAPTTAKADDVVIEDEDDDTPECANHPVTLIIWRRNPEPDIAGYKRLLRPHFWRHTRLVTVTDPTATIGVKGGKTLHWRRSLPTTSVVWRVSSPKKFIGRDAKDSQ